VINAEDRRRPSQLADPERAQAGSDDLGRQCRVEDFAELAARRCDEHGPDSLGGAAREQSAGPDDLVVWVCVDGHERESGRPSIHRFNGSSHGAFNQQ
jgi:hypothetical protein